MDANNGFSKNTNVKNKEIGGNVSDEQTKQEPMKCSIWG